MWRMRYEAVCEGGGDVRDWVGGRVERGAHAMILWLTMTSDV